MKILIAISNNRAELNIQFVKSLMEIISYTASQGHKATVIFFDYYDVATMRNHAVKKGLEKEMDYIFFMDADMIYPHDSITKLLAHGKDCVAGFYVTRKQPIEPVHFKEIILSGEIGKHENRVPCTTGLVEQACGGFGGVLVSVELLKKMKYPYFQIYYGENNLMLGEDIYFFIELQKLGIKAYLDCDLKFGHVVNGAIFPDGQVRLT